MARYTLPGKLAVRWSASAPASLTAPTQANVTASTDLRGTKGGEALAGMDGWKPSPAVYDMPDYIDNYVGNVPGDVTYPQSMLTFYADDASQTIKTALAVGNTGYVIMGYEGTTATKEALVYHVRVMSNERDPNRAQAATYDVGFAILAAYKGAFAA